VDLKLRQKLVAALAFGSAVAHAGGAFAQPSYSIGNAPSEVESGAEFTVDVILDLDVNSSKGHEVSVNFTPGHLVVTEAVELGVPPYQFNLSDGVSGIDNTAGVVDQFEAGTLSAPIPPQAPFVVGQITFQAGDVGEATIIGFFGPGEALLDGVKSQPIDDVVFNSVSINVIPTPTPTPTPSKKLTVCHKGMKSISLPANAVSAHLAHGDTLGACP
jgi:hypothetical protein